MNHVFNLGRKQGAWSALQQLLGRCAKDGNSNTASVAAAADCSVWLLDGIGVGLLTTSMEPGELPDPARRGRDGKEVVESKGV